MLGTKAIVITRPNQDSYPPEPRRPPPLRAPACRSTIGRAGGESEVVQHRRRSVSPAKALRTAGLVEVGLESGGWSLPFGIARSSGRLAAPHAHRWIGFGLGGQKGVGLWFSG
jgi:hypothetical protein